MVDAPRRHLLYSYLAETKNICLYDIYRLVIFLLSVEIVIELECNGNEVRVPKAIF